MAFIFVTNYIPETKGKCLLISVQQLGQNLQPNESARYAVVAAIDYHQKKKDGNNKVRELDICCMCSKSLTIYFVC